MEKFAAAVTESKTPKSKLTDEMKDTLAGYWGSPWGAPRNQEVKERWIELDKKKGNEHSLMKTVKGHLKGVAQELGIKPRPATHSRHDHQEVEWELHTAVECQPCAAGRLVPRHKCSSIRTPPTRYRTT